MLKSLVPAVPPQPQLRRLLWSRAFTAFASAAVPVLITLTVLRSGGSASELSLVLVVGAVPGVLALVVSGHLVSRLRTNHIVVTGDLLNAAAALVVAVLALGGHPPVAALAACAVVSAVSSALLYPAYGTLITQVAEERYLQQTNALRSIIGSSTAVLGPSLAGLALTVLPVAVPWFAATTLFAVGACAVVRVPGRTSGGGDEESLVRSVRSGWSYFTSQRWLVRMTAFSAVWHMVVWAPLLVLGPIVLRDRYDAGSAWGYFEALVGVGGLLAAGPLGRVTVRRVLVPAVAGLTCVIVVVALFASSAPVAVLVLSGAVAGAGLCAAEIFWTTAMQSWIPEDKLPAMLGYDYLVSVILLPIGLALAPVVAGGVGLGTTLAVGGGIALVAAVLALADRRVRSMVLDPQAGSDGDGGAGEGGADGDDRRPGLAVEPAVPLEPGLATSSLAPPT